MEDIRHEVKQDSIELYLPAKNKGKFRWKTREDNSKYGSGFATATIPYSEKSYLEWQIGYDSEVNHKTKTTILDNLIFRGANGKSKNPYELSEILFLLKKQNLLSQHDIKSLYEEIRLREFSFDDSYKIQTKDRETVKISDFNFHQNDIVLPNFSSYKTDKGLSIEIAIKQQQYATGVQPMVYFAIPIQCFDNYQDMLGKTSSEVTNAKLILDNNNKEIILDMFKFFGMCSANHKHDVLSILNLFL